MFDVVGVATEFVFYSSAYPGLPKVSDLHTHSLTYRLMPGWSPILKVNSGLKTTFYGSIVHGRFDIDPLYP